MAGAGHDWGILTDVPYSGQWCRRCGYEQLSAFGQAPCGGVHPSGKTLDKVHPWTNDSATVAAAIVVMNNPPPDPNGRIHPPRGNGGREQ